LFKKNYDQSTSIIIFVYFVLEEVSKEIAPSLDTQDTFPLQEIDNEEISPTIESCVEAVKRLNNDECEKPTNEPEKHEESQEKPLQFQASVTLNRAKEITHI